jgi:tetratricopeptide (TPR) repeat protein
MPRPARKKKKPGVGKPIEARVAEAPVRRSTRDDNRDWLWAAILFLAVLVVYSPVCWAGFIWDDDDHLTANPVIIGPLGLKEIWTTQAASICPLVLTTFWVEHAIWGLSPVPYHLVNVLQHALCAIVLWRVLLSLRVPAAWLGAALWALHPLQVESVAWISEMKNTQSCLFFLLSILFFVKWLNPVQRNGQQTRHWNYPLALLFAALAMASKFSTAVLPLVLALCAWWCEGRLRWWHLLRLVPILVMSVIAGVVTLWPQKSPTEFILAQQGAQDWTHRIPIAGDVIWFYLGKLIWPFPLMAIYPRWEVDPSLAVSYLPLLFVIVLTVVLWLKRNSWARPWFFAWACFMVALAPFLTLINQTFWVYSYVEDHLQNLASIGPLALAGTGLALGAERLFPGSAWLQAAPGVVVAVLLGALAWSHVWVYQDEEALWTFTVSKNPGAWAGYNNLGIVAVSEGNKGEALADFAKSVELNPAYSESQNNLGSVLVQTGQVNDGIARFQRAMELNPAAEAPHINLGAALVGLGKTDQAIDEYHKAIAIRPFRADAHYNLGIALDQKGRVGDAMAEFQTAIGINPNYAAAYDNLGVDFFKRGQVEDGIAALRRATELDPKNLQARDNLAQAQAAEKK